MWSFHQFEKYFWSTANYQARLKMLWTLCSWNYILNSSNTGHALTQVRHCQMWYTEVNNENISLKHMKTELEIKVATSARDEKRKGRSNHLYTYVCAVSSHKLSHQQVLCLREEQQSSSSAFHTYLQHARCPQLKVTTA